MTPNPCSFGCSFLCNYKSSLTQRKKALIERQGGFLGEQLYRRSIRYERELGFIFCFAFLYSVFCGRVGKFKIADDGIKGEGTYTLNNLTADINLHLILGNILKTPSVQAMNIPMLKPTSKETANGLANQDRTAKEPTKMEEPSRPVKQESMEQRGKEQEGSVKQESLEQSREQQGRVVKQESNERQQSNAAGRFGKQQENEQGRIVKQESTEQQGQLQGLQQERIAKQESTEQRGQQQGRMAKQESMEQQGQQQTRIGNQESLQQGRAQEQGRIIKQESNERLGNGQPMQIKQDNMEQGNRVKQENMEKQGSGQSSVNGNKEEKTEQKGVPQEVTKIKQTEQGVLSDKGI